MYRQEFSEFFPEDEKETIEYTISEDDASNWVAEVSALLQAHIANLDSKMLSEVVTSCVQRHVKITDASTKIDVEMVFTLFQIHFNVSRIQTKGY